MLEILKKSSFFIIAASVVIFFLVITANEESNHTSNDLHAVASSENLLEQSPDPTNEASSTHSAIVDVKGAVLKPGVYEVSLDKRVNDVILLAGGFKVEADQSHVNLAQKVQDEMVIIVPAVGEAAVSSNDMSGNGKVRINYATQEEIEKLPGIGPSKAQSILQYREENGYYQTVEDLLKVSGIGEKTLENMKDDIQIP
ncbi:helix-hairpin-helix domain-containing protein [Oceanobacillus saliphilus]|uniref:helix-hairpin-helix domain-containing protein n=1 Tax=Oceanobacillus saliphilus TaxID=2925834 RepID=UPI00201DA358|nr:helix-hairpin-helix domain-containing protein [Oceanobacillus saliphilus]